MSSLNIKPWLAFLLAGFLLACLVLVTHSSHSSVLAAQGKSATCHPVELNFDPGMDVHAVEKFKLAVADLLKQERFDDLDCIADQLRSSRVRFAGGLWQLRIFYAGVEEPWVGHTTELDWQTHIDRLKRWVKANPSSITARVALGEAYGNYAWDARGTGTSDTVSETGWGLFRERLETARKTLDDAAKLDAKCPEWYVAMQKIARGQGWEVPQATALLEKAIAFDPAYYSFYGMHATYLLPKWYGEEGDTARFAGQAADRIGGKDGDILYFQIALRIVCPCDEPELLRMSWARIQKGAAEADDQYGSSLINLNGLALLAVKFGDGTVANDTFKRLGDNWDKPTWQDEDFFKNSATWAATLAVMELNSKDHKQKAEANLQTPEGVRYVAAFEEKLAPLVQQCVQANPEDREKFEFVMAAAEDGSALPSWISRPTPVEKCLIEKFRPFPTAADKRFPIPPKSPYWVKLDLDPAKFEAASN
jgi:hypothetical protein